MKKSIMLCALSSILIYGSAYASGAQTGMVMGANVGYAVPVGDTRGFGAAGSELGLEHGNIAGGLFAGYDYALNSMFSLGVEFGAQYTNNFTRTEINPGNLDIDLLSVPLFVTLKAYLPYIENLNLFAKAGYAYNQVTIKTEIRGTKTAESYQEFSPVIAVGIGYKISDINIFTQVQYNWMEYGGDNRVVNLPKEKGGLVTISVGASYTLPQ